MVVSDHGVGAARWATPEEPTVEHANQAEVQSLVWLKSADGRADETTA